MPSPYRAEQLSPEMRERYGVGRRNIGMIVVVIIVIALFFAAVAWATTNLGREAAQYRLLTWKVTGPTAVDVEFEVRNSTDEAAVCVVRAQDENRFDVGYAIVTVPPGSDYVRVPYELVTLAPAFAVELLGCEAGREPNVPAPNFPPGVAPPQ
jgi:Domain of unknown function (DUF4307)